MILSRCCQARATMSPYGMMCHNCERRCEVDGWVKAEPRVEVEEKKLFQIIRKSELAEDAWKYYDMADQGNTFKEKIMSLAKAILSAKASKGGEG